MPCAGGASVLAGNASSCRHPAFHDHGQNFAQHLVEKFFLRACKRIV